MRILVLGLKKRDASSLEKIYMPQGVTTLYAESINSLPESCIIDLDLAIVDSNAVADDNLDILREMGAHNEGIPVILITEAGQDGMAVFSSAGMVPHRVERPISVDELSSKIKTLLPVMPMNGSSTLRAGDLVVDLETRTVSAGDKKMSLTPKEMTLFEYFLAHPNQVLSRSKLLEGVWGYDFDPESNIVDVYIRYLREKLTAIGKKDAIETVRGSGYRIVILSEVQTERKRRLQMSVVTFTGVIASILLIAGLFITYNAGNNTVQRTQGPNFEEIAKQTAKKTESALSHQVSVVGNLAIAPDVRELFDGDSMPTEGANVIAHFDESMKLNSGVISSVQVADVNGELIASTSSVAETETGWVEEAIGSETDGVFFGDVSYPGGRPVIDMMSIVRVSQKPVGVVRAKVELQGLFASITGVAVGETGHTMLVDHEGIVVICPVFAPRSHTVGPNLTRSIINAESGWEITDENPHGGRNSVAGFATIDPTSIGSVENFGGNTWHILLAQRPEETYSHVYSSLVRAGVLGIGAVAIVTLLSVFLGRRIIKPGTLSSTTKK